MRLLIFCMLFAVNSIYPYLQAESLTPEDYLRRINAHLIIKDTAQALREVKESLLFYPDHTDLQKALIVTLAEAKRPQEMLTAWKRMRLQYPSVESSSELLETMSWGILNSGFHATALSGRLYAMMGAVITHDVKSVAFLQTGLNDSNFQLRFSALQLATFLQDRSLNLEIVRLLKEEKMWITRLAAIQAAGKLKIKESLPVLEQILANEFSSYEEKVVACVAIASIIDHIDSEKVHYLVQSDRAGLRMLACKLIGQWDLQQFIPVVLPLINDPRPEVRASVLEVVGLLRFNDARSLVERAARDADPTVGIMGSWCLTLIEPNLGQSAFALWLERPEKGIRNLAAAALATTGPLGRDLLIKSFEKELDPFIRANLAVGLIRVQELVPQACAALYDILCDPTLLMIQEVHSFEVIAPSSLSHIQGLPSYPETQDQFVRLHLLQILAFKEDPHAAAAIIQFLKEKTWGITGMAAATLVEEADEYCGDLIAELLESPDQAVKIQAALVLAMWLKDPRGCTVLLQAYDGATSDMKIRILEAFGFIKDKRSVAFLEQRLQEPFAMHRIVAASSLIRCLDQ